MGMGGKILKWRETYKKLFFSPTIPDIVRNTLSSQNKVKLIIARRQLLTAINERDNKRKRLMGEAFKNMSAMDPMLSTISEYIK